MRLTAALLALAIVLTGVNADIVVFNEANCGGGGGLSNVPCDDSCNDYNPAGEAIGSFRVRKISIHKYSYIHNLT